jgi:AraC family transcriptional regulator
MVCNRCIMMVGQELAAMGIKTTQIQLGEVTLSGKLPKPKWLKLGERLSALGFELMEDAKKKIIEKAKNLLIKKIQGGNIEEHFSISKFLKEHFPQDHHKIARLFSDVESMTLEQYFILLKIEKVKEWLTYDELTLSEIAWRLGYSSVAHLSAQFRKVTGLTAGHFKKMGHQRRNSLDKL